VDRVGEVNMTSRLKFDDNDRGETSVAAQLAGGSDGKDATAGKPCCYR